MKKTLILSAVTASLLAGVQYAQANAVPLAPGTSFTSLSGATVLVGGTSVASSTGTLSGADTGTLTTTVYTADPNNTLGGLTFVYQINLTGSSSQFDHLVLNGYAFPSTVDVGYETGSGAVPTTADRVSSSGNPLDFYWASEITTGSTVQIVVETGLNTWGPVTDFVLDGAPGQASALAPNVPDGGMTMVMLGGAFCVLGAIRRKLA